MDRPMLPDILPPVGDAQITRLEGLRPFMKNVSCKVIVLKKMDEVPTKDGHIVCTIRVADESGSAILTLWDQIGLSVEIGDILLVMGGFVTMFQNEIRLACKLGTVVRQGRFCLQFSDLPDHSSFSWISNPSNPGNLIRQEQSDGKRLRSRTKEVIQKSRQDPRLKRHQNYPDQSALH